MFRIKVCGVTSARDAHAVVAAGGDAIGLNFYEKSSRHVSPAIASDVVGKLDASIVRVGVFVNATADKIAECVAAASLDMVQLHGDESPEFLNALNVDVPLIRAFRVKSGDETKVQDYLADCFHERLVGVLIDAAIDGQFGGTGHIADWDFVARVRKGLGGLPIILAGGLTPLNVGKALALSTADAVDTASGVESSAGVKDHELVRRFVDSSVNAFKCRELEPDQDS